MYQPSREPRREANAHACPPRPIPSFQALVSVDDAFEHLAKIANLNTYANRRSVMIEDCFYDIARSNPKLGIPDLACKTAGLLGAIHADPRSRIPRDVRNFASHLATISLGAIHNVNLATVANTARALARLEVHVPQFIEAVASRTARQAAVLKPQDVANLAWAFSRWRHSDDHVVNALIPRVIELAPSLTPALLAPITAFFDASRVRDLNVLKPLAQRLMETLPDFSGKELSMTARALANIGYDHRQMSEAIAQRALEIEDNGRRMRWGEPHKANECFGADHLARMVWALAILLPQAVPKLLGAETLPRDATDEHRTKAAEQCFHKLEKLERNMPDRAWMDMFHAICVTFGTLPATTPARYSKIAGTTEARRSFENPAPSRFERQVKDWLESRVPDSEGWQHGTLINGVEVDWTATIGGRQVAVECDGWHFHRTRGAHGQNIIGKDKVQDTMLKLSGYKPVHVWDRELNALASEEEQNEYLRKLFPAKQFDFGVYPFGSEPELDADNRKAAATATQAGEGFFAGLYHRIMEFVSWSFGPSKSAT